MEVQGSMTLLFEGVVDLYHIFDKVFLSRHHWLVIGEAHDESAGIAIIMTCKIMRFLQHVIEQLSGLAILAWLITDRFCGHAHLMNELADSAPTIF